MSSGSYRLPLGLPHVRRAEGEGAVAGVCAGIGKSLGIDATLPRLTFALLAFAGGAGIVAYGGAWLAMATEHGPQPSPRRRLLGFVTLAIAGAIALRGFGFSDSLIWPGALCGAGILLARGRRGAPFVAGLALVAVGIFVFIDQSATAEGRNAAFESSAVAIALLLVLGPMGVAARRRARCRAHRPDPPAGARRDGRQGSRLGAPDSCARPTGIARPASGGDTRAAPGA